MLGHRIRSAPTRNPQRVLAPRTQSRRKADRLKGRVRRLRRRSVAANVPRGRGAKDPDDNPLAAAAAVERRLTAADSRVHARTTTKRDVHKGPLTRATRSDNIK